MNAASAPFSAGGSASNFLTCTDGNSHCYQDLRNGTVQFAYSTSPCSGGVQRAVGMVGTFDEVVTSKLRLEIDSNDTFSTGILEWKVYDSGRSPDFPPRVDAGVDRVVVRGGKTYLAGQTKTLAKKARRSVPWVDLNWLGSSDAKTSMPGRRFGPRSSFIRASDWNSSARDP